MRWHSILYLIAYYSSWPPQGLLYEKSVFAFYTQGMETQVPKCCEITYKLEHTGGGGQNYQAEAWLHIRGHQKLSVL